MANLLPDSHFRSLMPEFTHMLKTMVELESPTTSKAHVDLLGNHVAQLMRERGAEVTHLPQELVGDHWVGSWGTSDPGILLLFHLDTVYPLGTLAEMPWQEDKHYIMGPGVMDMKASIVMSLLALTECANARLLPEKKITMLCTSDEETGSLYSRSLIEDLATKYELVLCMEPALRDGSLKTWRKGISNYVIEAQGIAAHAGASIEDGVNAIVEIGYQIPEVLKLGEKDPDTTINIGVVAGGTRSNVVAEHCRMEVDVRTMTQSEGDRIADGLQSLQPLQTGTELRVTGGWNRPPMERSPLIGETFGKAHAIADKIGLVLTEGGTGGGSDANFVAPLGIPILDGLGAIGMGAHSRDERIEKESLPMRLALLAALITDWWNSP